MSNTYPIRSILLALMGLTFSLQTACNNAKKAVLTNESINQLRVPAYLGKENKAAEEEKLSIVQEALRQVMKGTRDINKLLNIPGWGDLLIIEAAIAFDAPIDLLDALKNKGLNLKNFDYESRDSHPSLISLVSIDASYESLEWVVENSKKLTSHPSRPPYFIAIALWQNTRLTDQQREALIKALVPKGLNINHRADGETLLHYICLEFSDGEKQKEKKEKKKQDVVEWLFSIDNHIDVRKSLHMEDHGELVPWEIAYVNDYNELAAALISKMSSLEAGQKTIDNTETAENASGPSHIDRFKSFDSNDNGYEAIREAFLSIPGVVKQIGN